MPGRGQGGVYLRLSVAHLGDEYGSGAHVKYITREDATMGRAEALVLHDDPDRLSWGDSYAESQRSAVQYHTRLEREEHRRPKRGPGEARSYYRIRVSFEGKVETEKAAGMAREFLEENFPRGRAIAAVHQNTDHTHVHIHLQARDRDGKKHQFGHRTYRDLDERWARLYGREFGVEKEAEHLRKKEEKREWLRERFRAKAEGRELPERPRRVKRPVEKERDHERAWRTIERAAHAADRGDRAADDGQRGVEAATERGARTGASITDSQRGIAEAIEGRNQTQRSFEKLGRAAHRYIERERGMSLDR